MAQQRVTRELLDELLTDIAGVMGAYDRAHGHRPRHVDARMGRRYVSLMVGDTETGRDRFVYGYVDLTNGNILMAHGRFGPDPVPRGNLFDRTDPSGKPGRSCLGPYGVKYLDALMAEPATAAMVERLRAASGMTPGVKGPVPAPGAISARRIARRYLRIARWTPKGAHEPGPWHLFEAYEVNSGHYETLCGKRPSGDETPSLSAVANAPAVARLTECAACRSENREPTAI